MQRIIIENFGPIQHLDLEIKDLSLFIGEQATGKSTVAKLVYFFKSLRGDLIDYLYNPEPFEGEVIQHFIKGISHKFSPVLFGSANRMARFRVIFKYADSKYLEIMLGGSQRNVYASVSFKDNDSDRQGRETYGVLLSICREIEIYRNQYFSSNAALSTSSNYREIELSKRQQASEIEQRINTFFGDDRDILFIPASRSLLATLSEHLQGIDTYDLDFLMKTFLKRISRLKPAFNQPIAELIEERRLNGNHLPDNEILNLSIQKIRSVLRGEYRTDRFGEKIYFDDNNHVKLSMASSGQQEAIWILMQIFVLLLNRDKVFLIIEEPEAHLFPEAQKSVVELITLLFKENNSQVLITTHSPYILTAFNNLIYAGNVGREHVEEVGNIIPQHLWINSERVGAYKLRSGVCEDLMDRETMLIRAEELDSVSRSINEAFDAILNLELQ